MERQRLIDVIELAILVVEKNGRLRKGEVPRLAQVLLGNMMFREDPATAAAIAWDIDPTDGTLSLRVKSGWNPVKKTPPGPLGQGIELCHDVVSAVHKIAGPEGYQLIRAKVHRKRWGDVAKEFPGRDSTSLKEDYYDLLSIVEMNAKEILEEFDDFLDKNVVNVHQGVKMLS